MKKKAENDKKSKMSNHNNPRKLHIKRGPDFPTFAKLYAQELSVPWNPNEFKGQEIPAKLLLVRKRIAKALRGNDYVATAIENRVEGAPIQTTKDLGEGKKLHIIFDEVAKDSKSLPNEEGSDGEKDAGTD